MLTERTVSLFVASKLPIETPTCTELLGAQEARFEGLLFAY